MAALLAAGALSVPRAEAAYFGIESEQQLRQIAVEHVHGIADGAEENVATAACYGNQILSLSSNVKTLGKSLGRAAVAAKLWALGKIARGGDGRALVAAARDLVKGIKPTETGLAIAELAGYDVGRIATRLVFGQIDDSCAIIHAHAQMAKEAMRLADKLHNAPLRYTITYNVDLETNRHLVFKNCVWRESILVYDEAGKPFDGPVDSANFTETMPGGCPGRNTSEHLDPEPEEGENGGKQSPPQTTITAAPTGTEARHHATIYFKADRDGASFECSLDGAGWVGCANPKSYSSLGVGGHIFRVRATVGGITDPTPDSASWTIVPPDTEITAGPQNSASTTAMVYFRSTNDADATFQCQFDSNPWVVCTNPKAYSSIAKGQHTVRVRAVDQGAEDPVPASITWTRTN